MILFWAAFIVLAFWGLVLVGVALFLDAAKSQETFIQRFAVAHGGLATLAALPLGYWFGKAGADPTWLHLCLMIEIAVFCLAVPATVLAKAPAAWRWGAAWRTLVLLLPSLSGVATFFFSK